MRIEPTPTVGFFVAITLYQSRENSRERQCLKGRQGALLLFISYLFTRFTNKNINMSTVGDFNLDVVKQLDTNTSRLFFSVITSSLDEMIAIIEKDKEGKASDLTMQQVDEINSFYTNILDLFIEKEMYEECTKIKIVLEYLQKNYYE